MIAIILAFDFSARHNLGKHSNIDSKALHLIAVEFSIRISSLIILEKHVLLASEQSSARKPTEEEEEEGRGKKEA